MQVIKYFPQLLLSTLLIRILITGASIGDALSLIGLASLFAFHLYLDFKKIPEPHKDLKDRVKYLEDKLNSQEGKLGALTLSNQRLR